MQVIRDAQGVVGKVFLLRLDLADMPANTQTIIRQRHYCESAGKERTLPLHHALQVSLRRIVEQGGPEDALDSNGNVQVAAGRCSERTYLHSSIRVVFSFNQAATIGAADLAASPMDERLLISTEHLFAEKYLPLGAQPPARRASQHGQIL